MKLRVLPALALIAMLPAWVCPAAPDGGPDEMTELAEQMDRMSGAFRKLRRQAGDATMNAASLELVGVMREAAEAAQACNPAKAADLPEAQRAKFTGDYRTQVGKLLALLTRTEAAIKDGDNAAAVKLVGEMGDLQKAGHKEFRKPEPR
jgi:soluble cytochrome b562